MILTNGCKGIWILSEPTVYQNNCISRCKMCSTGCLLCKPLIEVKSALTIGLTWKSAQNKIKYKKTKGPNPKSIWLMPPGKFSFTEGTFHFPGYDIRTRGCFCSKPVLKVRRWRDIKSPQNQNTPHCRPPIRAIPGSRRWQALQILQVF